MIVPLIFLAINEWFWWRSRRMRRANAYALALAEARAVGLPLVVIGAPDRGATAGYPCGDITVDLGASSCPNSIVADVTTGIPLPDSSAVVFVSCVLEYVRDLRAAVAEIERVSGGRTYVVGVEPWTIAGWLYPGTRTVGAANSLRRRFTVDGIELRSLPFCIPCGQGADWVSPMSSGGRMHVQQFPDGRWTSHVDVFDPERGLIPALLHIAVDVPRAALRCLVR